MSVCVCCETRCKRRGKEEICSDTATPSTKDSFPIKSAIPARKVAELKLGSKTQQSLFAKPDFQHPAAAGESFPVSYLLDKIFHRWRSVPGGNGHHSTDCFQRIQKQRGHQSRVLPCTDGWNLDGVDTAPLAVSPKWFSRLL